MTDVLTELTITDDPFQTFDATLAGKRCFFAVSYNGMIDRWSFDLTINDVPAITGRRIVLGVDLLKAFNLGAGKLFAFDYEGRSTSPDRASLPARLIRFYHYGPDA